MLKLTRQRAKELVDAGETWILRQHPTMIGPADTIHRYAQPGAPTSLVIDYGDTSEWVYETFVVEPDWIVHRIGQGLWVAGDSRLIHQIGGAFSMPWWKTKDRAEAHLKLLSEDWWDD